MSRSFQPVMSLLLAALFLAPALPARAEPRVHRGEVIEYGIFKALPAFPEKKHRRRRLEPGSIPEPTLVDSTTRIPAKIGTSFGFRYRIDGEPNGAIAQGEIRIVHPRFLDSMGKSRNEVTRWNISTPVGAPNCTGWTFDSTSELVPGKWKVQVRYGWRVLASKSFEVSAP